MDWISVNDRLPEKDQKVLFCIKRSNEIKIGEYVNPNSDDENPYERWEYDNDWISSCFVNYWTPIINPPKEIAYCAEIDNSSNESFTFTFNNEKSDNESFTFTFNNEKSDERNG